MTAVRPSSELFGQLFGEAAQQYRRKKEQGGHDQQDGR
jgi:hypothetical protein